MVKDFAVSSLATRLSIDLLPFRKSSDQPCTLSPSLPEPSLLLAFF